MLKDLMNNPYAWGFLSLLSVVSFLFAIYTWFAGKKCKEISVSRTSNIIVKNGTCQIPKLTLTFDGQPIPDLTSSKFYIWNSGNDIIHKSDIVDSRPICILNLEDACILDAQIIRVTEATNEVEICEANEIGLILDFDYLAPGDGVLIQVLHSGNPKMLVLDGKIKGGKDIRDINERTTQKSLTYHIALILCKATIISIAVVCLMIILGNLFPKLLVKYYDILIVFGMLTCLSLDKLLSYFVKMFNKANNRDIPAKLIYFEH